MGHTQSVNETPSIPIALPDPTPGRSRSAAGCALPRLILPRKRGQLNGY